MAKKLTPEEQEVYRAAIKTVSQVLPKDQRGNAPSIASRLFKLEPEARTQETLEALFEPYGRPLRTIKSLVERGVLMQVPTGELKGTYALCGFDAPAPQGPQGAPAATTGSRHKKGAASGPSKQRGGASKAGASGAQTAPAPAAEAPGAAGVAGSSPSPAPDAPLTVDASAQPAADVPAPSAPGTLDGADGGHGAPQTAQAPQQRPNRRPFPGRSRGEGGSGSSRQGQAGPHGTPAAAGSTPPAGAGSAAEGAQAGDHPQAGGAAQAGGVAQPSPKGARGRRRGRRRPTQATRTAPEAQHPAMAAEKDDAAPSRAQRPGLWRGLAQLVANLRPRRSTSPDAEEPVAAKESAKGAAARRGAGSQQQSSKRGQRSALGNAGTPQAAPAGLEGAPAPGPAPVGAPAPAPTSEAATPPRRIRFEAIPTERKQTPQLTEARARIIALDPRLWMNGWLLSHPRALEVYGSELASLDRALAEGVDLSGATLTKRELSYRLFGREKFLDLNADGRKLLRAMGLDQTIRYRKPANAELLMHVPVRKRRMRVVVSENLDPWLNIRERLYGGASTVLGVPVDGAVFGNGWAASQPDQFHDLVEGLGAEQLEVLYWGDIDRSGVRALCSLQAMAEQTETCVVRPFAEAYRLMAARAQSRFPDPAQNETTQQPSLPREDLAALTRCLAPAEADYVGAVLAQGRLVPQEIVTLADL